MKLHVALDTVNVLIELNMAILINLIISDGLNAQALFNNFNVPVGSGNNSNACARKADF